MSKLIVGLVIGLIGLVVGVNLADNSQKSLSSETMLITENTNNNELHDDINALRLQIRDLTNFITNEKSERVNLQTELNTVKQQLALLQSQPLPVKQNMPETVANSNEPQNPSTELSREETFLNTDFDEPKSTSSILATIGVDPLIAENIERRSEKREMEQLYMRNKAIREGWFGTEKYFQENRKFEQETNVIREELGDNKYDEYLYKSGRFNRIKVSGVLAQSPAELAGIQTGDVIISYDNNRIFNWSDLTTMTATGDAGESVEVSVVRNNVVSKVFIPRGPMGVRLESLRTDPNS